MAELAIRAENLGKRYLIGGERAHYKRLSDLITAFARNPVRQLKQLGVFRSPSDYIWALKDVSFEISQGEVVGIIGRNGAGKTTLLKILSQITEPTEGSAVLRGKLGSLLEVGIGFHPDLTGRENIYLNGVILGMKKAEIDRKFDNIVAFAEVEKFINTPMKHYSTGMYVRLAFAVAAHLEPDILVIDEVLAVGDAAFQQKCLGKIGEVAKEGRTVLFVSHNMAAVQGICKRALLLSGGRLIGDGPTQQVVDHYLEMIDRMTEMPLADRPDRKGDRSIQFLECELWDADGQPTPCVVSGQDATLAIRYKSANGEALKKVHLEVEMYGRFNESLFQLSTDVSGADFEEIPPEGHILLKIPRIPLQPERYVFDLYCTVSGNMADYIQHAAAITVEGGDFFGTGRLPMVGHGHFLVPHSWSVAAVKSYSRTSTDG
jgi:lipopolysaccharide transport system ATP-binding protein